MTRTHLRIGCRAAGVEPGPLSPLQTAHVSTPGSRVSRRSVLAKADSTASADFEIGSKSPMRWLFVTRFGWIAAIVAAFSAAAAEDPSKLFAEATDAYLKGQPEAAEKGFAEIARQGYASPELYFNLGNACLSMGETGRAILWYRRAWRLNPRDPEIRSAMNMARREQRRSPSEAPAAGWLDTLRPGEWAAVAVVSYWLAIALAFLRFRRVRAAILPVILGMCVAAFAVSASGVVHWTAMGARGRSRHRAARRSAGASGAEPSVAKTFTLAEGTIAQVLETWQDWSRVSESAYNGWVPTVSIEPVSPAP